MSDGVLILLLQALFWPFAMPRGYPLKYYHDQVVVVGIFNLMFDAQVCACVCLCTLFGTIIIMKCGVCIGNGTIIISNNAQLVSVVFG